MMIRSIPHSVTAIGALVLFAATTDARAASIPSALYDALAHVDGVADCARDKHQAAAQAAKGAFDVTVVHLSSGTTVYRAQAADPCLGATPNAQVLAFVPSGKTFRQVLSIAALDAKFGADGTVVAHEKGSAATTYRETFRYDGTTYVRVRIDETYMPTNETKQVEVPLRFAAGASSSTVTGKVVAGFGDSFVLDAAKGQTMSVVVHPTSGAIASLAVLARHSGDAAPTELTPPLGKALAWQGKLPATGRYEIDVEGANERPATYSLTVAIR